MNSKIYKEPLDRINDYYMQIDQYIKEMEKDTNKIVKDSKIEATKLITKLDTLSPLKTLTRGFCITTDEEGNILAKAENLKKDMEIKLRYVDGTKEAKII